MKPPQESFCSLDEPWDRFSKAWKKARHTASGKSVHDLRVNARRLIEILELARALSKQNNVDTLKRRFKKFLKEVSTLRDLQVELEIARQMPRSQTISDFTERLARLEQQEAENVQDKLKRIKKRRLMDTFKDIRSEVIRFQEKAGSSRTHDSIRRTLNIRHNEFLKAKRRFQRSEPRSDEDLHSMRIALKKLRYAMEAAQPILAESERDRLGAMRVFQKLMGDSRDLEIFHVALEEWAKKKGNKMAVIPALKNLEEKREALLKKVSEASSGLETILAPKSAPPLAEKTRVARHAAATDNAKNGGRMPAGRVNEPFAKRRAE
jgi:CHAD domain-containing protein